MPRILMNNNELNLSQENVATIGDFLDLLQSHEVPGGQMITSVSINGSIVTDETRGILYDLDLKETQLIEVETETIEEVAHEAIDTAMDHAEAMIPVIQLAAQGYKRKDELTGDQNFILSMDAMELFVKLIGQIIGTLNISLSTQISEEFTIQELESHLMSILEGILKAREKDDGVAMAELLEFDLIENLVLWKDSALPRMRNLKSA